MNTPTNATISSYGGSRSWTARARAAAAATVLASMTGGLMFAGAAVAAAAPGGNPEGECAPFAPLTKFDSPFLGDNPSVGGTASSGGVVVTVTGVDDEEGVVSFDWTSAALVTRIVVKAGAGNTLLSPDAFAGSVTHSAPPAISHVTFCTGEPEVPEVDEPDVPEVDEPDVPEVDEPDVPGIEVPEIEEPEIEEPEAEVEVLPIVDEPEIDEPEIEQPEVERPEAEEPEAEQPEVEQPEAEQPEAEEPEAEEPEVEEPEIEVLPEIVEATPAAVVRTTAASAQLPRTGTAPLLAALLGSGLIGSGALILRRTRRS